jgi:hypothetical protein
MLPVPQDYNAPAAGQLDEWSAADPWNVPPAQQQNSHQQQQQDWQADVSHLHSWKWLSHEMDLAFND